MRGEIKGLTVLVILAVVILSVLGFTKYLDAESGIVINDGSKLTLRMPNLPHLNAYLNGSEYEFGIENVCLIGFLLLLTSFRVLLLRKAWR